MTDPDPRTAASAGDQRPGARLLDLVAVMDRLRSPGGCPWDARQTHESLVEYLVEEAYETVEAIETGDRRGLREELGDVALQVVFHARIAAEDPDDPWTIDDVADGIITKLVARHPHVFADGDARTPEQVETAWATLKAAEKGRASALDGIPAGLPALARADAVLSRADRAGLTADAVTGSDGVTGSDPARAVAALVAGCGDEADLGDLLVAVVAAARSRDLDAERAAREAVRRMESALRDAESGRGHA